MIIISIFIMIVIITSATIIITICFCRVCRHVIIARYMMIMITTISITSAVAITNTSYKEPQW